MLCTKVEGHNAGNDYHYIIRADVAPQRKHCEYHQHHDGNDGFDFNKIGKILFHCSPPMACDIAQGLQFYD